MEKIMVSIICLAYNQENFIAQCLEGMLMQKTSFCYEILINDDASTDGTASIIKQYEEKYPQIIRAIYQSQNQYSKGTKITRDILLPKARGKYIAFCEGDDYWTDNEKLEKQVVFLENNSDYSACYSSYEKVDINGELIERVDFESLEYDFSDSLYKPMPQSATCVIRKNIEVNRPDFLNHLGVGDIPRINWAAYNGKIYIWPESMSCYRLGNPYSWSVLTANDIHGETERLVKSIRYYKSWDQFSNYQYHNIFLSKIGWSQLQIDTNKKKLFRVLKNKIFISFSAKEQVMWIAEMLFPKTLKAYQKKRNQ